ncbi:4175_t:CDS:2, partial [Diversispora eburnea]
RFQEQVVFIKDCFYSVGDKIVPLYYGDVKRPKMTVSVSTGLTILNKAINSNKCPLKVSLVGILQELLQIVFQHLNPQFVSLKNIIRLQGSLVFVVDQMEVIDNDFYLILLHRNVVKNLREIVEVEISLEGFTNNDNTFSSKPIKIEPIDKLEKSYTNQSLHSTLKSYNPSISGEK